MKKKYNKPKIKILKLKESYLLNTTDILNSLDSLIFTPVFASDAGGCGGEGSSSSSSGGDSSGSSGAGGCGDCES